ncbi:helix-turn-helix domain-containing protein [Bacillus suaedaesalsae]|uniref:Helix-turn-helix domain-containing protein n=1 Tax=Bacillus suaedaesalsae TaxID=2810349 RepID=A0ABS2DNB2_9BACI|nr:helix-turn-helix domain-containing protein [Bacillus suaedaesalsae]
MNYFPLVILYCIKKNKGERSISSIYHLLKGKRSAQTIQDAKLYQTFHLFGVFPLLDRNELEENVFLLQKKCAIESDSDNSFVITKYGEELLTTFSLPSSLNGWKYAQETSIFWGRLSLLVQVCSNLMNHETRYIPISRDVHLLQWVKKYLNNMSFTRNDFSQKLYNEFVNVLENMDEVRASIFVSKLTGHNRIGSTNEQVGEQLSLSSFEVSVLFTSTIHHILALTENEKNKYPLLSNIMGTSHKKLTLTQSTEKTFELVNQGYSIEAIAKIRQLKKNTIEDHIVEIALSDEAFDISPYIKSDTFKQIEECIMRLKTNQLKLIKNSLEIPVGYFEIRLALAKVGSTNAT